MEELSQVQKESEKKDSNLKSALKRLKESDTTLQHAFRDKEVALAKGKDAESSFQRAYYEKVEARKMDDSSLSEMEKKATSWHEIDQLWSNQEEALELEVEDRRKQ